MAVQAENLVICTDINQPFIYGTFLELLFKLENETPGKNSACIIIGDAHSKNLKKILELTLKTGIQKERITIYDGIKSTSNKTQNEIKNFAEAQLKKIKNTESLYDIIYKDHNLGIPILSNLISKTNSIHPKIIDHIDEIYLYIKYSLFTYISFIDFMSKNKKTFNYYIYNGRHYNTYPISLLTPEKHTYYYERFDYGKRLCIIPNRIHDFEKRKALIENFWNSSNLETSQKSIIAHDFFKKHLNNKFTKNFNHEKVNTDKKIVTFFISSEDEFASLHPSIKTSNIFKNQRHAIEWLTNWAKNQNKYTLVLRVHPHYEEKSAEDRLFWNQICGENLITVPSHSNINSYNLMLASEKSISFLSTTGIEAAYLGIPSILIGNSPYKGLGATHEPERTEDLTLMLDRELSPLPQENTLPYGFFANSFGSEFKFIKSLKLNDFSELLTYE
ncbi:Glycosyltransferase [Nitrincola lacisaponensis]|uniref:Glycosyltransferase n=1 Tax=Nitrincola lacisaponensis TaxID=267850 RepID=A0A063Y7V4_9GAMM|nr:hypothetical protein [Nitrincola lacisaponensis]KDE40452.1 Glycosyltransferase [Nitrincola lacisaponensis]